MKAEKTDRKEQVQELTKKLEDGITALFESDRYLEYLTIMARFHHYSYRNTPVSYTHLTLPTTPYV